MRGAYYNEIDPYAAQWLRNLIAADPLADSAFADLCDARQVFLFDAGLGQQQLDSALEHVEHPEPTAI
jgi:hypothetical protein